MRLFFTVQFLAALAFYYVDLITDVLVALDYLSDDSYYDCVYYFGISMFAIGCGMIASAIFSYDLVIYRYRRYHCIPRLIFSFLHLTPVLLLFQYMKLTCCSGDDEGPNNLIQLTSIDAPDAPGQVSTKRRKKSKLPKLPKMPKIPKISNKTQNALEREQTEQLTSSAMDPEQSPQLPQDETPEAQDLHVAVGANGASGAGGLDEMGRARLTSAILIQHGRNVPQTLQERRSELERLMRRDMTRIKLVDAYFHAPIQVLLQVYILGNFVVKSDGTRVLGADYYPPSLDEDATLFWRLLLSCLASLASLSYAAYSRVAGMIDDENYDIRCKGMVRLMFAARAALETLIRAGRFMIVSVVLSASFGVLSVLLEVIWKYFVFTCVLPLPLGKNANGSDAPAGGGAQDEQNGKETDGKKRGRENLYLMMFRMYSVATWMLFSHERSRRWTWLMRIADVYVWTAFVLVMSYVIANCTQDVVLPIVLGICPGIQNDCIPVEFVFGFVTLWALLLMIYCFSPSIFTILDEINVYSQGPSAAADGARTDIDYVTRKGGILGKTKKYAQVGENNDGMNGMNGIHGIHGMNGMNGVAGGVEDMILNAEIPYDSEEDDYINPEIDVNNPGMVEYRAQERVRRNEERRRSSTGSVLQSIDDAVDADEMNDDQRLGYYAGADTVIEHQRVTLNNIYSR